MARKIALLEPHGTKPSIYLKKSAAMLLITRLLADWEVRGVSIRRRMTKALPPGFHSQRFIPQPKPFIPERLPPAELPGIRFIAPLRPEWTQTYEGCAS